MTHVNVRRDANRDGYVIEVSNDGAAWVEHWFLPPRGENQVEREIAAKADARIYASGIKYGGGEVRLTAFGDEVYVPDLSTVAIHHQETGGTL